MKTMGTMWRATREIWKKCANAVNSDRLELKCWINIHWTCFYFTFFFSFLWFYNCLFARSFLLSIQTTLVVDVDIVVIFFLSLTLCCYFNTVGFYQYPFILLHICLLFRFNLVVSWLAKTHNLCALFSANQMHAF